MTELNELIGALAREKGLPPGIHPDLIGPDPSNHGYWGQGQEERHRQSVAWRARLIAELKRRPEFVEAWRAEQRLNEQIRDLCEARGWTFKPWECPPWRAPDELPADWSADDRMHAYYASLPQAVRLRKKLIAELR